MKPNRLTSAGQERLRLGDRFWVLTWSMSTFESMSKVTASVIVPSLALVDFM
jgi:hypothetical protein